MPFKSKAQFRKFIELEKRGKLPEGTVKKWLSETENFSKLPERKKFKQKRVRVIK